jgi:CRP-like cAMP-binding protein
MEGKAVSNDYFIWGIDDSPYGPVELSALIDWISDERVLADTWVFARHDGSWRRAAEIPGLQEYFSQTSIPDSAPPTGTDIAPGSLRRIKILSQLNDAQLDRLAEFMELHKVPQWSVVVNQGDPGDGMFLVLQGELRARVKVGDNVDSTVLKISDVAFDRLTREAPALATPFLQATARTLAARIRADNKRLDRVTQQFRAST